MVCRFLKVILLFCEILKPKLYYIKCINIRFSVGIWTVRFSPDSRFVASGSNTGKINLFRVESGNLETQLDTRGKATYSIAYVSFGLSSAVISISFLYFS